MLSRDEFEKCGCLDGKHGIEPLRDEWNELLDELSDVMFALGRVLGDRLGIFCLPLPFQGRHIEKMRARHAKQGCVRSSKHLVDGHCPSAK